MRKMFQVQVSVNLNHTAVVFFFNPFMHGGQYSTAGPKLLDLASLLNWVEDIIYFLSILIFLINHPKAEFTSSQHILSITSKNEQ